MGAEMPNSTAVHHDVPHYAIFHSRNTTGVCPVCYISESRSWAEMAERLRYAQEITLSQLQSERESEFQAIGRALDDR